MQNAAVLRSAEYLEAELVRTAIACATIEEKRSKWFRHISRTSIEPIDLMDESDDENDSIDDEGD